MFAWLGLVCKIVHQYYSGMKCSSAENPYYHMLQLGYIQKCSQRVLFRATVSDCETVNHTPTVSKYMIQEHYRSHLIYCSQQMISGIRCT
jgi:hypothetical protein